MAKTVDNFATIEDFRKQYNELAYDVGDINGLNGSMKLGSNDTIVDALNVLDNKQFFLQEFVYVATANQVTFTGADGFSNTLLFRKDKIQVYKNERHLVEDVDYIVASPDGSETIPHNSLTKNSPCTCFLKCFSLYLCEISESIPTKSSKSSP